MTDEEIKETVLYKDCYERVKQFPELAGDLVPLLREAQESINPEAVPLRWGKQLSTAFIWSDSKQGRYFWEAIQRGVLPKEYE